MSNVIPLRRPKRANINDHQSESPSIIKASKSLGDILSVRECLRINMRDYVELTSIAELQGFLSQEVDTLKRAK